MKKRAFTLIELLVVIAIIAILAAILFPVFVRARENARRAACQSNMKQIGLAFVQYTQDFDEKYPLRYFPTWEPGGLNSPPRSSGLGWGSQVYPYVKSRQVFTCPSDPTQSGVAGLTPVSYGYNHNLPFSYNGSVPMNAVAQMNQTARTVLAFEMAYDVADVSNPADTQTYSAALGGSYGGYAYRDAGFTRPLTAGSCTNPNPPRTTYVSYHTGLPYNRVGTGNPFNKGDQYNDAMVNDDGRHLDGSNYLFIDGHVKWLKGTSVSGGDTNPSPTGNQTASYAQGTDYAGADKTAATFSQN